MYRATSFTWTPDDYAIVNQVTFKYRWVAISYLAKELFLGAPKVELKRIITV